MTKEPDKHVWESNYQNKSVSGLEVRDKNGKVVHFIAINHNETLHDIKSHRVIIKLDENGRPLLPPPQTFDEMIQAKRRQQMLLYGSGATSSSSHNTTNQSNGTTTSTAARRAAAATKRAKANLSRRSVPSIPTTQPASSSTVITPAVVTPATTRRSVPGLSGDTSKARTPAKKKKPPTSSSSSKTPTRLRPAATPATKASHPTPPDSSITDSFQCDETIANSSFDTQISTTSSDQLSSFEIKQETNSTSKSPKSPKEKKSAAGKPVVTSMKDLNKNNPLLSSMDPKEVKQMVRSAPPGTSIVLPNGTVIRKSRRGGARAGAGRKRSRPLPPGQQQPQQQSSTPRTSTTTTANGNGGGNMQVPLKETSS